MPAELRTYSLSGHMLLDWGGPRFEDRYLLSRVEGDRQHQVLGGDNASAASARVQIDT